MVNKMKTDDYLNYLKQQTKNIVDSSTGFCHACNENNKHQEWCIVPRLEITYLIATDAARGDNEVANSRTLEELALVLVENGHNSYDDLDVQLHIPLIKTTNIVDELKQLMRQETLKICLKDNENKRNKAIKELESKKEDYSEKGYQKELTRITNLFDDYADGVRKAYGR